MKLLILFILTSIMLSSCNSGADFNYINTAAMKDIYIANGPFYGKTYDTVPSYAEDLLAEIDKAIMEQGDAAELVDDTIDPSEFDISDENLLYLQLVEEDNSLSMIDVFIISDEEGILSFTEQSADETQTRTAHFKFTDAALIEEAKSVLTALEAEYDAQS